MSVYQYKGPREAPELRKELLSGVVLGAFGAASFGGLAVFALLLVSYAYQGDAGTISEAIFVGIFMTVLFLAPGILAGMTIRGIRYRLRKTRYERWIENRSRTSESSPST